MNGPQLASDRAAAVRGWLEQEGIEPDRIVIEPSRPKDGGGMEPAVRSVEIVVR